MMLQIKNLNVFYGHIHAIKDLSIEINEGEIVTLIGSNGAGKTTTLNSIQGVKKVKSGSVLYYDKEITNMPTHEIVKQGISLSPEGRLVFPELSVAENLKIGAYTKKDATAINRDYERVYDLFPRLAERKKQQAGTLSGGEQQMLAIGRALMNEPKLLMLDEPSLGLAPNFVITIFQMIKRIRDEGVTILLVEQNANMALHIADRGYVLETGRVTVQDSAKSLMTNDQVRKAYLGG